MARWSGGSTAFLWMSKGELQSGYDYSRHTYSLTDCRFHTVYVIRLTGMFKSFMNHLSRRKEIKSIMNSPYWFTVGIKCIWVSLEGIGSPWELHFKCLHFLFKALYDRPHTWITVSPLGKLQASPDPKLVPLNTGIS